ncbi:hypothetical protein UCRPA7_6569 [Phaeoacremonium minimum UCRPA7]|uniref:Uncharacterized protein n=1 Tax=Phaeoacremonium minimum (strain UCR-PA7) TaxID=1286976 RepID=R8BF85_PHAM7|nr:hypothetical protein UCRPA7_6569 [Phaeoacremonium minimum UCRPA7]EON97966.1 hypothetical protein UCRPA7_6569 [Phaeoacremonium minimum UCRPA7]
MLADLSDLNAAEPQAAVALVSANKTITSHPQNELKPPEQRHHQRVASASATVIQRNGSPATRFDKFGRKILTPPLTRSNSAQGSMPGTPRRDFDPEDDVDRASTLMALYEIRAKLKQQDNTSLLKAREKISALAARQQAQAAEKKELTAPEHRASPRFTYPRTT